MKRYKLGDIITNPESGDAWLFCGYEETDSEVWAEIWTAPNGNQFIQAGERRSFEGFNGPWTRFTCSREEFAASVEKEIPCEAA